MSCKRRNKVLIDDRKSSSKQDASIYSWGSAGFVLLVVSWGCIGYCTLSILLLLGTKRVQPERTSILDVFNIPHFRLCDETHLQLLELHRKNEHAEKLRWNELQKVRMSMNDVINPIRNSPSLHKKWIQANDDYTATHESALHSRTLLRSERFMSTQHALQKETFRLPLCMMYEIHEAWFSHPRQVHSRVQSIWSSVRNGTQRDQNHAYLTKHSTTSLLNDDSGREKQGSMFTLIVSKAFIIALGIWMLILFSPIWLAFECYEIVALLRDYQVLQILWDLGMWKEMSLLMLWISCPMISIFPLCAKSWAGFLKYVFY